MEYLVYEPDAGTAQYLCKGNGIVGLNCHLENVSRKLDEQDLDDENDGDEFEKEFSDDAALVASSSSKGPYYADTICVKNAASAWVGWKSYDEENGALVAQSKDSNYGYYGTVTECDGIDGSKANEGDNIKTIITISTHDHVMDGSEGVIYKPGAGKMQYKCKGNELIRYNCFPDM